MDIRAIDLHGAISQAEVLEAIQHNLDKAQHVGFQRIADRCKATGLGALGIEELAVRLAVVAWLAGVELYQRNPERRIRDR